MYVCMYLLYPITYEPLNFSDHVIKICMSYTQIFLNWYKPNQIEDEILFQECAAAQSPKNKYV